MVGLQTQLVKQNFEIQNSKTFYKQEVHMLQSEIGEIKKDFSQTLIDVKSSMLGGYGMPGGEDDITSTPDIEYTNNSVDEFNPNAGEEERMSILGKNSSFLGASLQINHPFVNMHLNTQPDMGSSNQMTSRSRNSTQKNHHIQDYDSSRRTNRSTLSKNSEHFDNQSSYFHDKRRSNQVPYTSGLTPGDQTSPYGGGGGHHPHLLQSAQNSTVDSKKPPRNAYTFNHHYYQQHFS